MKSYSDISQSKTLSKILPIESADMVYFGIHQGMDGKYYLSGTNTEDDVIPIYKNFCTKVFAKTTESDVINQLPCWSLATLLGVLPDKIHLDNETYHLNFNKDEVKYLGYVTWDGQKCISSKANTIIDACVEMIIKLNELKLLQL